MTIYGIDILMFPLMAFGLHAFFLMLGALDGLLSWSR